MNNIHCAITDNMEAGTTFSYVVSRNI